MDHTQQPHPTSEKSILDKFLTWLNGIDFDSDEELYAALSDIEKECQSCIDAMTKNVKCE